MSEYEESDSLASSMQAQHYVFVDGPSVDGTLGRVLNAQPDLRTRPDWHGLIPFVRREWGGGDAVATFVMWSPGNPGFMNFLERAGFRLDVADRTMDPDGIVRIITERIGQIEDDLGPNDSYDVMVATHNRRLIGELTSVAPSAKRVGLLGFDEWLPADNELDERIEVFDLEGDARLFRVDLGRSGSDGENAVPAEAESGIVGPELRARTAMAADSDLPQARAGAPARMPRSPLMPRPAIPSPSPSTDLPADPWADADPSVGADAIDEPLPGPARDFYLLVDGRSIDQELGEIIGEKPQADSRPRWELVYRFAMQQSRAEQRQVKAVFVHIGPGHAGFKRALQHLGYRTMAVMPDGFNTARSVVEEAVCRVLEARALRGEDDGPAPDVMVIAHGVSVFERLNGLPDDGQRLMALGFPERMPVDIYPRIERFDIEHDATAFLSALPRVQGVDVDEFDPDAELDRLF